METLLLISTVLWIVLLVNFFLNYFINGDLNDANVDDVKDFPFISIIVPARDEEEDIEKSVTSYCEQDYPAFEVIVVDDQSSDRTPEILNSLKEKYSHLKVIRNEESPEKGWLGKPNALEIGRKEAKGDWYLFADADIDYHQKLLKKAFAFVTMKNTYFMTILPLVRTKGVFEAAIMSTIYFISLCAYPGYLIERTKSSLFSAGAGVFNLVEKNAFLKTGAFETLKDAVVDDIMLGKKVKEAGFKITATKGIDYISVRMYPGARATIKGFTKNMYPFMKKVPFLILFPFVVGTIISFIPYIGFIHGLVNNYVNYLALASLCFMHAAFLLIVLSFRQPWYVTFLNPLRELGWMLIFLRSFIFYYKEGGIIWRGRKFKG